jgi:nucleotide-binding universal stress UspA family protein
VTNLALTFHSSLVLLHVLDGYAARLFGAEAVSPEIQRDRVYLESVRSALGWGMPASVGPSIPDGSGQREGLVAAGIQVKSELAYGEPADQIIRWVKNGGCDLVAMSTHSHLFVSDLLYGGTADNVRHHVDSPVLMLKARN